MSLRFHEIAETDHRLMNPISAEKLDRLGALLRLEDNMRLLDLACGKGEMLAQWALRYGVRGVGVDMSSVFIDAAKQRAHWLEVEDKVHFLVADAAEYPEPHHEFDLVSCLGATWIGGGLLGTLDLMKQALKRGGGTLVVGEVFWYSTPPEEVAQKLGVTADTFATLGGTLDRFQSAGLELVDMVIGDPSDFDAYEASRWSAVYHYLDENPDDPDADALHAWIAHDRHAYMHYGRAVMGWGAFVLQAPGVESKSAPEVIRDANEPTNFEVRNGMLWVSLADGRVIGNPLAWYAWLAQAPTHLQNDAHLHGSWIEWPELGGQVRVEEMLKGR